MKKILFTLVAVLMFSSAYAQEADPKDVESKDAILAALYDVISGPAGEKRDWDRMRSLFTADAKLIPSGKGPNGAGYRAWTVEQYITEAGQGLEEAGFFEIEINRVVEDYGTISHAFSTYESRRNADDEKPFVRGINSIQLLNAGTRWYIMNVFWMGETQADPIPAKYLPKN